MNDENIHTELTVADIQTTLKLIEVCSSRGAFRANELATVGALYQKLTDAIEPKVQATPSNHLELPLTYDK